MSALWPDPLSMLGVVTSAVAIGLLAGVAIKNAQRRADIRSLREALRELARSEMFPVMPQFRDQGFENLWRVLQRYATQRRDLGVPERRAFRDVITLGSRLAEASAEPSTAVDEVVRLLLRETTSEVVSLAVVLRNDDGLSIERVEGVRRGRIDEALLTCFDSLFDGTEEWGYHLPIAGGNYDFRAFGIGMSLTLPLRRDDGIVGGIWMGFREGATSLTPERRTFVRAVAEHAAGSFYAAQKMEQRSRQSSTERDFLLGLSHDLRAPGNSALCALRDLISADGGALSGEQRGKLRVIERALEEQLAILGDVLDYAKHRKGFLEPDVLVTSIRPHVERTVETFAILAERKGVAFDAGEIPEIHAAVDPRHLQRILSNLLSNAVKYTLQGTIRLSVKLVGRYVEISVADSGIGVPADQQRELFQEFRRMRNAAQYSGAGLGLALSKVLAEANGGYLHYRPNDAVGSVFTLGVPYTTASTAQARIRAALVVDDDAPSARTVARYLQPLCQTVVPASSVADALEMLPTLDPEVIVTDFILGEGTAEILLQSLRRRNAGTAVVVLTGSAQTEVQEVAMRYGASVVQKPITREVLQAHVGAVVGQESVKETAPLEGLRR